MSLGYSNDHVVETLLKFVSSKEEKVVLNNLMEQVMTESEATKRSEEGGYVSLIPVVRVVLLTAGFIAAIQDHIKNIIPDVEEGQGKKDFVREATVSLFKFAVDNVLGEELKEKIATVFSENIVGGTSRSDNINTDSYVEEILNRIGTAVKQIQEDSK